MNAAGKEGEASLIVVAHAVKTKGLKGEIVADLLTDFPERFEGLSQLYAISPDGLKRVELESYSIQRGRLVLKLAGYDTVEMAQTLVGCDFAVTEAERFPLPEDQFYDWELQGCVVETIAGRRLGKVGSVMRTGGVPLLRVERDHGESLIPLAESIVRKIDREHKRILIDPPDGLLEL